MRVAFDSLSDKFPPQVGKFSWNRDNRGLLGDDGQVKTYRWNRLGKLHIRASNPRTTSYPTLLTDPRRFLVLAPDKILLDGLEDVFIIHHPG
jgi:hypothetical protein